MMGEGAKSNLQLESAALLISDFEIDDPKQLVAMVGQAYTSDIKSLVVVAKFPSEQCTAVLVAMSRNPKQFHVIAIKAPDETNGQVSMLEDLALFTGRPYAASIRQ
jgi:hypothetical protein